MKYLLNFILVCVLCAVCRAADSPEDMLRQAQQFENDGSQTRAVQAYQDFLKQFPDHSQALEARYRLARCFDALGSTDEAIAQLEKTTAGDPKSFKSFTDALYQLGKLQASKKKYPEATAAFEKMIANGAGIYEDEVLGLLGGYYALLGKYDDAASKLNLLKRKGDPAISEQACYKLALLWFKAEKTDQAIEAISDLAQQYPSNKQIPELLLKAADVFRNQKKFDKTISVCEQLRSRYPKSMEAAAGNYLLGMCYRDRQDPKKALEAFDALGSNHEPQARALAAEALVQSADILQNELPDQHKAMQRYEEAAKIARDVESDRQVQILEQCYFRLGEYHFSQKHWSVALEYYVQLRTLGSKVNVGGRIAQCQAELGQSQTPEMAVVDDKVIKERIANNAGKAPALEAEIMLADRNLQEAIKKKGTLPPLAAEYERLVGAYPKEVLASDHLGSYLYQQIGMCYSQSTVKEDLQKSIAAYEKVNEIDTADDNPYRVSAIESVALVAERVGDKDKSQACYKKLFEISKAKLAAKKDDPEAEKQSLGYLKSILTRADSATLIDDSIAMARKVIEERGPLSEMSRESRYYIGELFFLKKDYSSAAKAFEEYIQIYGPKQDAKGDLNGGPWKPGTFDAKVDQIYEAAARIAHAWQRQGHQQNMLTAYGWIVRNIPTNNKYIPEAQYTLTMASAKGADAQNPEARRNLAETLWKNVVGTSLDFDDPKFARTLYAWTGSSEEKYDDAEQYVRVAMMKAGQIFAEAGKHELAIGAFRTFLDIYAKKEVKPKRNVPSAARDDMADIARYALGREYIATQNIPKMAELYKVYFTGRRDDRFRPSGLKLLAYYCNQSGMRDQAIEAYATLLDEYGPKRTDAKGNVVIVPIAERLRPMTKGWDGYRLDVPPDLDLGETRFALGLLYWQAEDFAHCAQTLAPFLDDKTLAANKSRDKALYMAGQCYYRQFDPAHGVKIVQSLIEQYPHFEAIEEAYVYAARGYAETKAWSDVDLLCKKFIDEWPRSDRRSRIDLYSAMSLVAQKKTEKGLAMLENIAKSETYEDVRADAWYQLALNASEPQKASEYFDKSVAAFASEYSCLDAAKCAIKLKKFDKAKPLLERVTRDFPKANPAYAAEANQLLPQVQVELAKQQPKK